MRFLSHITKYKLVAVHQGYEILASGMGRVTSPGFTAEWTPHDATDAERTQIRKTLKHRGTVRDEGFLPVDPIDGQHRVSVFDTNTIANPELRERVEKALLTNTAFGTDYILADTPARLTPPYALYDKHRTVRGQRTIDHAIRDIVAAHESAGFDVAHAVAYERENGNDEKVVAALEALTVAEPGFGELVTA